MWWGVIAEKWAQISNSIGWLKFFFHCTLSLIQFLKIKMTKAFFLEECLGVIYIKFKFIGESKEQYWKGSQEMEGIMFIGLHLKKYDKQGL